MRLAALALAVILAGCAADVPQQASDFAGGSGTPTGPSGLSDDGFYDGGVFDQDLVPDPGRDGLGDDS